jgi:hypothetical protein
MRARTLGVWDSGVKVWMNSQFMSLILRLAFGIIVIITITIITITIIIAIAMHHVSALSLLNVKKNQIAPNPPATAAAAAAPDALKILFSRFR